MYQRMYEHLGYYKKDITICWVSPHYSKYTTLRVEDSNKNRYKADEQLTYKRNDRFIYPDDMGEITVRVKKEYRIPLVRGEESENG